MKSVYKLLAVTAIIGIASCSDDGKVEVFDPSVVQEAPDFTDLRDGNTYKCVKIGKQIWLAENLRYYLPLGAFDGCFTWGEKFVDSSEIKVPDEMCAEIAMQVFKDEKYGGWSQYDAMFQVLVPAYMSYVSYYGFWTCMGYLAAYPEYVDAVKEALDGPLVKVGAAKSHFEEAEAANGGYSAENGFLYSYEGALAAVPDGWRLPSDKDWIELETTLGMDAESAGQYNAWRGHIAPLLNFNGDAKFNARYAGGNIYDMAKSDHYLNASEAWYFWTSDVQNYGDPKATATFRMSAIYTDQVWRGESRLENGYRSVLYSVRLVRDAE